MSDFNHLIGKNVRIEISGKKVLLGLLIDVGLDILVIYNREYYYLPIGHIHFLKLDSQNLLNVDSNFKAEQPFLLDSKPISFRKTLINFKGSFVKIYVSGNQILHGYLTSIMNDYFVFYSPVYKVMFISMNHLKWLIPYKQDKSPYSLAPHLFPVNPTSIPLARSFTEQLKKMENHLIILDGGDNSEKIGVLQKVENNKIRLLTDENEPIYWNCQHLKTVQFP